MGGYRTPTTDPGEYAENFWNALKSGEHGFEASAFQNAASGEGGTAGWSGSGADPNRPLDPNLAMVDVRPAVCSRVITTSMNLNLPYQSAKATAAIKAESNNSGTNHPGPPCRTSQRPNFKLTSGRQQYASWELLQDSKACADFLTQELARIIRVEEGSSSSTDRFQPAARLSGQLHDCHWYEHHCRRRDSGHQPISNPGSSDAAYYGNATWLVTVKKRSGCTRRRLPPASSRRTSSSIRTVPGVAGYPEVLRRNARVCRISCNQGAWLFGDFNAGAVIGDRGDSNIRIKVLDQVAALNGQTVILGNRRVDQRVILSKL